MSKYNPHIAWIYSDNLSDKMDAATFLAPTQELRNLGWKITLIAAGDPDQPLIRGVQVCHIPKPSIYLLGQLIFQLRAMNKLYREIREIDVLLFHELSAPLLLAFMLFLKLIRKNHPLFVMDTRTLPMEPKDKSTWKDRLRGTFSIQMNKLGNRFFDGRTTITERMAQSLQIPPEKLWGIWHSGVNLTSFANAAQSRRYPKPEEPIQLIYIGSMHHERNLLTLSKAVTQANTDQHNFTLTIIGDGTGRVELEEYAMSLGRHVHVLHRVPFDEIPRWLSKTHIGTLPFPDEEKFRVSSPIKLFEYLAAGMPILATRIVCHTDVIEEEGVAFWAEGSDQEGVYAALMQIHANREKLPEMGKNAAELARQWTWQSSTENLKQALEYGIRVNNHL